MVNKRKNIPFKIDIIAHILFVIVPLFFIHVLGFNSDFVSGNERFGVVMITTAVYLLYMLFFVFFCGFTERKILLQYLMRYFVVMYTGISALYTGMVATFIHSLCVLLSMLFATFVACKEIDKKKIKTFVFSLIIFAFSGILCIFVFSFLRNNDHIAYSGDMFFKTNIVIGSVGIIFGLILYLCTRKSNVWFYSMLVVNPCPATMAMSTLVGILISKLICRILLDKNKTIKD